MTKIKLCGLRRVCDIEAANALHPEYVGFVFAAKSRRYISPEKVAELKDIMVREHRSDPNWPLLKEEKEK